MRETFPSGARPLSISGPGCPIGLPVFFSECASDQGISTVEPVVFLLSRSLWACTVSAPFGVRDLADIQAFVGYFIQGRRAANLADPLPDPHDAPVLDLADIQAFLAQFMNCE